MSCPLPVQPDGSAFGVPSAICQPGAPPDRTPSAPAAAEARDALACECAAASVAFLLDDFSHGDAELLLDQHDFAARDQPVVDVDVDRLADLAVELEHCTRAEPQQVADVHAGAPEHGGDLHRHVEYRFEIG